MIMSATLSSDSIFFLTVKNNSQLHLDLVINKYLWLRENTFLSHIASEYVNNKCFFVQMIYLVSEANESAKIAKVVARQRASKKTGQPHLVNTRMRVKSAAPLTMNGEIITRNQASSF